MAIKDLKTYLSKLSKEKLIEHIVEIYSKNKPVKEYFENLLNPDPLGNLQLYKSKVYEAFFPKRGYTLKLANARKAITDFKKLNPQPEHLADIMLYYTEIGVQFTNEFGDIDEQFYTSMENQFDNSLKFMRKNNLLAQFKERCQEILRDTKHIGWGFYDTLGDIYHEYFKN